MLLPFNPQAEWKSIDDSFISDLTDLVDFDNLSILFVGGVAPYAPTTKSENTVYDDTFHGFPESATLKEACYMNNIPRFPVNLNLNLLFILYFRRILLLPQLQPVNQSINTHSTSSSWDYFTYLSRPSVYQESYVPTMTYVGHHLSIFNWGSNYTSGSFLTPPDCKWVRDSGFAPLVALRDGIGGIGLKVTWRNCLKVNTAAYNSFRRLYEFMLAYT